MIGDDDEGFIGIDLGEGLGEAEDVWPVIDFDVEADE